MSARTPLTTIARLISEQAIIRGLTAISKVHKLDISGFVRASNTPTPPTTANDDHASETILRTAQLIGVGNWMTDQAKERLDQLERELESEIRNDDPKENGTDRLFANAEKRTANAFCDIQDELEANLKKVATIIGQDHSKSLAVHHGVTGAPKELQPDKLKVLGLTLDEHFKKLADDLMVRFKSQIRIGLDAGDTTDELVKRIAGTKSPVKAHEVYAGLKTLGLVQAAGPLTLAFNGILDTTLNSFSMVILNAVASAAHDIEDGIFDGLDDDDSATMGIQWVCALENTCQMCLVYDGSQWDSDLNPVGDAPEYPGDPPEAMHPNCRCKTVTVDLSEQPAKSTGMDDYFRKQSPDVLAASFGRAPAKAFLEGDIDGKSLLSSGFKLSPEAFARLRPQMESI